MTEARRCDLTFASLALSPQILRAVEEKKLHRAHAHSERGDPRRAGAGAMFGPALIPARAKRLRLLCHCCQRYSEAGRETPRRVRSLILVPTRELAAQIGASIESYARYLPDPVKVAVVFGGVSINPQMMALARRRRHGRCDTRPTAGSGGAQRIESAVRCNAGARRGRSVAGPRLRRRADEGVELRARAPSEPAVLRDVSARGQRARGASSARSAASRCSLHTGDRAGHSISAPSRWTRLVALSCYFA